jgi:GPH family glycoside/pentoside/hexuronide:cation symporter
MLINPMIGDIADEDELKTKRRREGMFFGTNALVTKPASSFIIFIFTAIIEFYGYGNLIMSRFNFSALDNLSNVFLRYTGGTSQIAFGFRLAVGILPLAFIILAGIALYFYPLHGAKLEQIKKDLEIHHRETGVFEKLVQKNKNDE